MSTALSQRDRFTQAVTAEAARVVPGVRLEYPGRRLLAVLGDVDEGAKEFGVGPDEVMTPWQQWRALALQQRWMKEQWDGRALTRWVNALTESAWEGGSVDGPDGLHLLDSVLDAIRGRTLNRASGWLVCRAISNRHWPILTWTGRLTPARRVVAPW